MVKLACLALLAFTLLGGGACSLQHMPDSRRPQDEVDAEVAVTNRQPSLMTKAPITAPPRGVCVYFAKDGVDILPSSDEALQAQGDYLLTHPGVQVTLEGHADERGSAEYNLALAERRTQFVWRLLRQQGVSQNQLRQVSYGAEKPAMPGQGESVWQKNRRVEFSYNK